MGMEMVEFHGSGFGELIKNLILSFSGLGLGAALWMVVYDLRMGWKNEKHVRRLWFARAGWALSFFIIILLVAEAIYKTHEPLPVEWRVLLYTVAIVLAGVSALGVAYETRRARRQLKLRSFELIDADTGDTVSSHETYEQARRAYLRLSQAERYPIVIVEFDERGFAV